MIGVQQLYNTVNEILSVKGKGGFASNDMFNDDLRRAQVMLQNYYLHRYSLTNFIDESLSPFLVNEAKGAISNGVAVVPSDYRHVITAKYVYSENAPTAVENSFELYEIKANEWNKTHDSPIRFADITKRRGFFSQINSLFRVSFSTGELALTYFKKPPLAIRQVTVNSTTKNEDYEPTGSVDLVWNESDEMNLVDIMLSYKSIQIRESAILQWVSNNKANQ